MDSLGGILITYHGGILINIGDIDTRGRKKKYLSQEKGRETRF